MAEGNKNGLSEAVEQGAGARAIRGAIKTGKAISATAKGAAAGGPYGAVAGALWGSRKHIGKIIVAVILLLLLPVIFVLMLPGLIFEGLTESKSSFDTENPILNSNNAIIENANEIVFTVNGILSEGLEDVFERIEQDFEKTDADKMEVINPYENDAVYNVNLFAAQYSAAKNQDIKNISISDMEKVLRKGKKHLYSYKVYNEKAFEIKRI